MEPLIPGYYYHIYNHSNGNEQLFREDKNYSFFLEKYKKYIDPVVHTMTYCLMPNHFHILVRIKVEEEIVFVHGKHSAIARYQKITSTSKRENFISGFISKQFSNFFSSYTQAYNRMYNRKGSLFLKNFKRKRIEDDSYFIRLVNYIHLNPVEHGFVLKPEHWKYSSYNTVLSAKPTLIEREEILEWFDGISNFMYCHLRPMEI